MTLVPLPTTTTVQTDPTATTPADIQKRLYKQLVGRRGAIEVFDAYYRGDHPLPWLAPQAREEFRRILRMTRSNYMGLVCDAVAERAALQGFRLGKESEADDATWRLWQANNLDADSDQAWLEALIAGRSFFGVAPNETDRSTPLITVEHPAQVIVGYEAGTNWRVRKASLKVWDDEWTGEIHSTLYLLDRGQLYLFKHKARSAVTAGDSPTWERREVRGEEWPARGQMDAIPHVEVPNNPRLLTGGISELYDLTDSQDRVNKTLADRLITQDYGAFPQKWAVAWPDEDDDGKPNTIDVGRNRMVTTDVKETKFGQWEAAPLDPYSAAKREDVKDIASRSRTPAQYLLGEMSNVNGSTLQAAESGLVSKVRRRTRTWGEAAEEVMRLARRVAGIGGDASRMEAIWSDPQYRTPGEMADASVKLAAARVISNRQARRDQGYSETTIKQIEADLADEAMDPVTRALMDNVSGTGGDNPPLGV